MHTWILAAALATSVLAPARAGCLPVVRDAWLRLPPMAMPMLAGFARIENPCPKPVAITGARSAAFGEVSLHETRQDKGMSRMRAVPVLGVPARGSVALQPGGLHLMLMQPGAPITAGARVPVTLVLRDGRSVSALFEVRPATTR